jgi:hypothetical protein
MHPVTQDVECSVKEIDVPPSDADAAQLALTTRSQKGE